jgi:phosphohistidine phosphatase
MYLYLMRHGIAVAADEPKVESDETRPLTSKGAKRIRRAARGLRRLGVSFDAVLTSPLLRARQTAEIVAAELGLEAYLEEIPELAPQHSVDRLVSALARFDNKKALILVGHEPLLGFAFSFFMGGRDGVSFAVALKKGGVCCIEIDALPPREPGTLQWFLTPKQLRRLGDKKPKKVSAS